MNSLYGQELLDDILDAYVTEVETPNLTALKTWIRKYPQYQKELTDFTIAWIQMEELPPINRDKTDHDILVLRAMSVVQNLHGIGEKKSAPSQSAKKLIEKLVAEGEAYGYSQDQFATQLKLSVSLLWKLDRHLIEYSTIPVGLMEKVAKILYRGLQVVAEYFLRQPTLATNARYKAKQQPQVSEPKNFFDEVRSDTDLSNEDRAYWLAFEPPN